MDTFSPGIELSFNDDVDSENSEEVEHIYLFNEMIFNHDVVAAAHQIRECEADTLFVHLSSVGGDVDVAILLGSALLETKAKTIAVIEGTVASAAVSIMMACDFVQIRYGCTVMVHDVQISTEGNPRSLIKMAEKRGDASTDYLLETTKQLLNAKQRQDFKHGKDIWLDHNDLYSRLSKLKKVHGGKPSLKRTGRRK